ncbi:hypothetical protein F5Y19DRAFT_474035 [Xylariaceae sp. FL1651]|nr:hypothetical protein F5Y19DRAFT_474035 [Xylariaceae sp. FL1651]
MAGHASPLYHLELIREKTRSSQESDILVAFACHDVGKAVSRLGQCCPPLTEKEEAQDYLWMVWSVLTDIVKSPDVTSDMHEYFVYILQSLKQIEKGELPVYTGHQRRVWRDLPLLLECAEASSNNPMAEVAEFTPETAQIWYNLNSPAARTMAANVLGSYDQVIFALKEALETKLNTDPQHLAKAECRIWVACEWIAHGSKTLLLSAQENIGIVDVPEDGTQYFSAGPLYEGPPAVCPHW